MSTVSNVPTMKWIVIDDYKPLYALRDIRGPERGPIRKPVRYPIDIIEKLLKQKNNIRVYEVIMNNGIPSERIELTLDNYTKSWYELKGQQVPKLTGKIKEEKKEKVIKKEEVVSTADLKTPEQNEQVTKPAEKKEITEDSFVGDLSTANVGAPVIDEAINGVLINMDNVDISPTIEPEKSGKEKRSFPKK